MHNPHTQKQQTQAGQIVRALSARQTPSAELDAVAKPRECASLSNDYGMMSGWWYACADGSPRGGCGGAMRSCDGRPPFRHESAIFDGASALTHTRTHTGGRYYDCCFCCCWHLITYTSTSTATVALPCSAPDAGALMQFSLFYVLSRWRLAALVLVPGCWLAAVW